MFFIEAVKVRNFCKALRVKVVQVASAQSWPEQ